ncbi:unnamed protein product [Meganyctiphanes norvegica]|uniref:Uncharacterized protein n=1 Tax=Meganyctiphanes norvegica TaxID=48144 RepID=A0AAV2SFL4_MEGNR
MGRRNKKKREKGSHTSTMPSLSPELMEQILHSNFMDGYYSRGHQQEIEGCIAFFGGYLFNYYEALGYEIISYETMKEVWGEDIEPEEVLEDRYLLLAILTSEALKKGFDNLLLLARFLMMSTSADSVEDYWEPISVDSEEQADIKRYLHINWRFRTKWGIHVKYGNGGFGIYPHGE